MKTDSKTNDSYELGFFFFVNQKHTTRLVCANSEQITLVSWFFLANPKHYSMNIVDRFRNE